MSSTTGEPISRFGTLLNASTPLGRQLDLSNRDQGLPRLWRAFMAARILVAGVLLMLILYLRLMGQPPQTAALLTCLAYLALTLWVRVLGKPVLPGDRLDPQWLVTVGLDVIVFGALLYMQVGSINFTPLFVLPVLLAAVLGPLVLALGTAAAVTLTLLLDALQYTLKGSYDANARYIQAAITSTGMFAVAYLANQMSARLVRQERLALDSEMAARTQIQVNQLVIENLSVGVLVVDSNGIVHAANPAARDMLGVDIANDMLTAKPPFVLASRPAWLSLAQLAATSLRERQALQEEINISLPNQADRLLHVKTQLPQSIGTAQVEHLCVMFMEDLREMQARVRTEKLAAMGRMSAAVAHEIRNPLSAIAQANSLLAEEIREPQQQSLVRMVAQNVQRLNRVVDDVLDVSRAQAGHHSVSLLRQPGKFVQTISEDWSAQNNVQNQLLTATNPASIAIEFEAEHLRRVLVNLLDNALRYASSKPGSIRVELNPATTAGMWVLSVWSDGAPIELGVQRHLFEPFFSSQSRSSGLGLYICRELCLRHGASISYQRSVRSDVVTGELREGNEFLVLLRASLEVTQPMPALAQQFP